MADTTKTKLLEEEVNRLRRRVVELERQQRSESDVAGTTADKVINGKQPDELLHDKERQDRALLGTIPHGILECDTDGVITFSSLAHAKMHGCEEGELVGKRIFELLDDESEQDELRKYLAFLVSELPTPTPCFTKDRTRNGGPIDVQVDWAYKRDEKGQVTGFVSVITDITKRKGTDEGLRISEERFRSIFEQAGVAVGVVESRTGRFVQINKQYENLIGYSNEEATSKTWMEITHADDIQDDLGKMHELSEGKISEFSMEKRLIHKDGSVIWINLTVSSIWNPPETPEQHIVIVEDVTDRKRAEDALKRTHIELEQRVDERTAELVEINRKLSEEIEVRARAEHELKLSAEIMHNMAEGVCLIRASDGELVFTNQRFNEIFGYESGELIGRHPAILNAPDQETPKETADRILKELEESGSWTGEVHNIRKDETSIWTRSSVSTFEHPQHGTVRVAVVHDITDHKQAKEEARKHQDELAHVARISTMGEMATGIAHELNQPLTAIATYSHVAKHMLDASTADRQEIQQTLEKLESQALRAGDIVWRLRNFAKNSPSNRVPADLNALVTDVGRFVEPDIRQAETVLVLKFDEPSPSVVIDEIQIQQVLVNLIRNAIDAMQEIPASQREVTVSTRILPDGQAEVIVSDVGKGLSQAELDQVFDAFFSTKQEGMGMGLPISRSIVEAHGGKLWAKPNTGPGVTFSFTIPMANVDAPMNRRYFRTPEGPTA